MAKQVALGTLLKLDHDDNATFNNVTLVTGITPPARMRAEIDGKTLGDSLETSLLGIELKSELEFTQHWHPLDTEHEKLDTLFESGDEVPIQIVTPHATPVTDEFTIQVIKLEPEQLTVDGAYKRKVTCQRTSAITRS